MTNINDLFTKDLISLDIDFMKLNTIFEAVDKQFEIKVKELKYDKIYNESVNYDDLYMEAETEKKEKKQGILKRMFDRLLNFIRGIRVKILKLFGKDDKAKELEKKIKGDKDLANQQINVDTHDDEFKALEDESKFLNTKVQKIKNKTITAKDGEEVKSKRISVKKILGITAGAAGAEYIARTSIQRKRGTLTVINALPFGPLLQKKIDKILNNAIETLNQAVDEMDISNMEPEIVEAVNEVSNAIKENQQELVQLASSTINDINTETAKVLTNKTEELKDETEELNDKTKKNKETENKVEQQVEKLEKSTNEETTESKKSLQSQMEEIEYEPHNSKEDDEAIGKAHEENPNKIDFPFKQYKQTAKYLFTNAKSLFKYTTTSQRMSFITIIDSITEPGTIESKISKCKDVNSKIMELKPKIEEKEINNLPISNYIDELNNFIKEMDDMYKKFKDLPKEEQDEIRKK